MCPHTIHLAETDNVPRQLKCRWCATLFSFGHFDDHTCQNNGATVENGMGEENEEDEEDEGWWQWIS